MDSNHFQIAERLFHEALERSPGDREAYIDSATAGDAELARRVKRMIDYAARESVTANLLADHASSMQADAERDHHPDADPLCGVTIGRYRIVERIGEGGFGSVYRAEQQQPVQREVAVKILKSGMDSRRVIARFDAERQTLAMMEHPNIARVFDAGQTDPALGSRPYFVMELVQGEPITDYCDAHHLTAHARLELFMTVCHAVQHAHHKGIIHRDLKPSNILISRIDGDAAAKVIDFGIAKAVHAPLVENPLVTQRMELLGTPQYMSPEQADPEGQGIDTRSDIYSLGVVLYELLTGTTPLDSETIRTVGINQMQRLIRDQAVERPSTRLTRSGERGREFAQRHNSDVSSLRRTLRGDLDWITLKALEADRERRYSSAAALADDIRRHLEYLPVEAGPPGARYRIGKFVRRNRVAVVAVALIMLALAGGATGMTVAMLHARDAAQQAMSVNDFMREVLTSADPDKSGANVRLVDVLQTASDNASTRFSAHPELEARVRSMLSDVYSSLSMWESAGRESQAAVELMRRSIGMNDPRTLHAEYDHIMHLGNNSRWREAKVMMTDLAPRVERVMGPDHDLALQVQRSIGFATAIRGDVPEGERILREVWQRAERINAGEVVRHHLLNSLVKVLALQIGENRMDETKRADFEALSERLVRETRERYGLDSHPNLVARITLARAIIARGDYTSAADQLQSVYTGSQGRFNDDHHIHVDALNYLAEAKYRLGERAIAADLVLQSMKAYNATANPVGRIGTAYQYLPVLEQGGRWSEGEAISRDIIDTLNRFGGGHPETIICAESFLASFISRQGRSEEASNLFASILARKDDAGLRPWGHALIECHYGGHLARTGAFAEAQKHLDSAVTHSGDVRRGTYMVPDDLVAAFEELYSAWGQPEKAEEYRQLRVEVLASRPIFNE